MEDLDEPKENMTDGEYLEMSNHLKKLYDDIEQKNIKLELEKIELKKILITSYGLVRVVDNFVDVIHNVPTELEVLVSTLRGYLSEETDKHIFNIKSLDFNEIIDIDVS